MGYSSAQIPADADGRHELLADTNRRGELNCMRGAKKKARPIRRQVNRQNARCGSFRQGVPGLEQNDFGIGAARECHQSMCSSNPGDAPAITTIRSAVGTVINLRQRPVGQERKTSGSSLTHAVRSNANPACSARPSLDIEVIQHFKMVGDKSDRADDPRCAPFAPRSSITSRMSGPIHGSGVRPALCQPIDQLLPPRGRLEQQLPVQWSEVHPDRGHLNQ